MPPGHLAPRKLQFIINSRVYFVLNIWKGQILSFIFNLATNLVFSIDIDLDITYKALRNVKATGILHVTPMMFSIGLDRQQFSIEKYDWA